MTKREMEGVIRSLAFMEQAYYSRGPEWIVREMTKAAHQAMQKINEAKLLRAERVHGGAR